MHGGLALVLVFILVSIFCLKHDWNQGEHSSDSNHDAETDFIEKQ